MNYFKQFLEEESKKEYYINLKKFIDNEYKTKVIFPERKQILLSMEITPYENIKVVILGQDPYHGVGKEGVLLLNSILTVEKDKPGSHQNKGWETFTDNVIKAINEKETPVVFMLWGKFAKSKASLITNKNHLILTSSHPSPFSVKYGFEGCSHFSKANKFLEENGLEPIDWQIEDI